MLNTHYFARATTGRMTFTASGVQSSSGWHTLLSLYLFSLALACSVCNTTRSRRKLYCVDSVCYTVQCGLTYHYVKRTTPSVVSHVRA